MKISGARLNGFLRQPDAAIVGVLVFGPDRGLVRERVGTLVATVAEDPRDPFRVVELGAAAIRNDPARLADEAAAMSFSGGRRVVRVVEAADALTGIFKGFLEDWANRAAPSEDALVVVEGSDLGSRSSLRTLFEKADNAAAIACYGDEGGNLRQIISETLARHRLTASADAIAYLAENLGADRMITRSELEKLALYKGGPGVVELEDAAACVGDSAAMTLDAVVHATAEGNQSALDRSLTRAFLEGASPVAVLRVAAGHFRRLHLAAGLAAEGRGADQAIAALKPSVIFKFRDRFRAQMRNWPADRLAQALEMLTEAEIDCKSTGKPPEAVCGRVLLRIAQAARRKR